MLLQPPELHNVRCGRNAYAVSRSREETGIATLARHTSIATTRCPQGFWAGGFDDLADRQLQDIRVALYRDGVIEATRVGSGRGATAERERAMSI